MFDVWADVMGKPCLVGNLFANSSRHETGVHVSFAYAQTWLKDPHGYAIDPETLPLREGTFHFDGLFPAMDDGAPDRWGRILIRRERPSVKLNALDYLFGLSDHMRVGNLRYCEAGTQRFQGLGNEIPPLVRIPDLLAAADRIETGNECRDDLRLLLGAGSPVGGARPKASVVLNDGRLAIAKFPKADDERSIAKGEILALRLAAMSGINVAEHDLLSIAGKDVSVIVRFDRIGNERLGFISARTLLGGMQGDLASYVDLADAMRKHCAFPERDLRELWSRIVFSRLVGNCDDHLRNHGFLRTASGWELSPAYDINPVPLNEQRAMSATRISDTGSQGIQTALECASMFCISGDQANQILKRQVEVIRGWMRQKFLSPRDKKAYQSAFNGDQVEIAKTLVGVRGSLRGSRLRV